MFASGLNRSALSRETCFISEFSDNHNIINQNISDKLFNKLPAQPRYNNFLPLYYNNSTINLYKFTIKFCHNMKDTINFCHVLLAKKF